MLFGEDYLKFKDYLVEGWFLFVKGSVEQRRFRDDPNDVEFKVRHIELLADVREKFIARLRLQIDIAVLDEHRLDHLASWWKNTPARSDSPLRCTMRVRQLKCQAAAERWN